MEEPQQEMKPDRSCFCGATENLVAVLAVDQVALAALQGGHTCPPGTAFDHPICVHCLRAVSAVLMRFAHVAEAGVLERLEQQGHELLARVAALVGYTPPSEPSLR